MKEIPVYQHSIGTARERGELDQYHESNKTNSACAAAIDKAVLNHNYELYHYDLAAAAKDVFDEFGPGRVCWVLAASINDRAYDGRFSHINKAWAKELPTTEAGRPDFVLNTHPAVLDGFTNKVRETVCQREQAVGRPVSLAQKLAEAKQKVAQQERPAHDAKVSVKMEER